MKKTILGIAFIFVVFLSAARAGDDKQAPLVVHEWGTFTSLQDEQGNAIGGINTDDEPVPAFVHRLGNFLIAPQRTNLASGDTPLFGGDLKVAPITHSDPEVLVRLETPVIYFYPPEGWKPQAVDVHVAFPGGWLSEFYPAAESTAPGFTGALSIGHLSRDAAGELAWKGLILGGQGAGPQTDSKVWLAPREVKAARVSAVNGESEKFLFYRGVGNVDPALRVARNSAGDLEVRDNDCKAVANVPEASRIHAAWLVDVRADGACAFKSLGAVEPAQGIRATMPGSFAASAYSAANMEALRGEMRAALVKEGLFTDEADALLNTWQVSYFQNPGLRFFYMCPRAQIEAALPLTISAPSKISRVMIGRVEIVTPGQRALLKEIAAGTSWTNWTITTAKLVQDYHDLGRFRNALILDEQKLRPTAALNDFINRYSLAACFTPRQANAQAGIGTFTLALLAASGLMLAAKFLARAGRKLLR